MMGRLFKKTQSNVQQETPKANMLKKFGGKFKKAFSKKQQVYDYPRLIYLTITLTKLTLISSLLLSQRIKPISRMFSLGHQHSRTPSQRKLSNNAQRLRQTVPQHMSILRKGLKV